MNRGTFVIFGIVFLLFAVLIPAWAISREGSSEASPESVPESFQEGKDLFVTNCGACHTLAKAGTDGIIAPDLDDLLAPPSPTPPDPATIKPRVLAAIETGVGGRMPKGILGGAQAETVADFVAACAGAGPGDECAPQAAGQ
jgi:mono/diheme cytochrome c family protein